MVLKNALYDYLDWLEKERPELIDTFWKAAFKDVTMEHCRTLRKLHSSLLEGQILHSDMMEHRFYGTQRGIGVGPKLGFHGQTQTLVQTSMK